MKKLTFALTTLVLAFTCDLIYGQQLNNLDFEILDKKSRKPQEWYGPFSGGGVSGYVSEADSLIKTQGKYSLKISIDSTQSVNRSFGACSITIPARYAGTKIQLKGYLKTENISSTGYAGLWMRIDGPPGVLAFDNMENKKIVGTNNWKEYSIELPLDEDAASIVIGGLLVGNTGKIWLDDLKLFIDGEDFQKAPQKQERIYRAKQDTAFNKGSGITRMKLNKKTISNLQLLGHVWGFLKYYHPAIAAGKYNWDYELFRFLPSYSKAKTDKARDKLLLDWINKLGPVARCNTCIEPTDKDVHMKADFNWMENKDLDLVLKKKLEDIRNNRNQKSHYYVSLAPNVSNPVFKNEDSYSQFPFPDAGFRALALFRYWNIIQYFFPYKYAIQEDWNKVLQEFIPRFMDAENSLDYKLTALELIGRIHDTHANLWGSDSVLLHYKGKFRAAVQTKFIEDRLVVTNYYDADLGRQSELNVGDVITHINNSSIESIVKQKIKIYPASNYPTKLRDMAKDMLRGNTSSVNLTIQRNGNSISKTVPLFPIERIDTSIDWAFNPPDSCYKFLSDNVGYIYLGNIKSSLLPQIFQTFKSTKGIVIDIRNYPSEFVVFSMSEHLLEAEKQFVKFSYGDITYPGTFRFMRPLSVGKTGKDNYKGKIVILINELTQSSAEYTTMALRTAPNVTVLGSTTAGADGNVSPINLPGNLNTMISGIGVFYPDGKETQRVGIVPDIEVKPTIQGIREKRDELIERAIQIIEAEK